MSGRPSGEWRRLFITSVDTFILIVPILFMIGATTSIDKILRAILSVPLAFALCLGSAHNAHYAGLLPGFRHGYLFAVRGTSMLPPSPIPYVYGICSIPITVAVWNAVLYRAGLGHREWMFTICVGQS
ncbi:hypothetical protein C8R47DRAFT_1219115 [Mycena vitilis]|nr:hypothetical protein C8R47DRAFT_1219115 [Mycena vitilis]